MDRPALLAMLHVMDVHQLEQMGVRHVLQDIGFLEVIVLTPVH